MAATFSGSTLCDHLKIRFKSDRRSHPMKPVEQQWKVYGMCLVHEYYYNLTDNYRISRNSGLC